VSTSSPTNNRRSPCNIFFPSACRRHRGLQMAPVGFRAWLGTPIPASGPSPHPHHPPPYPPPDQDPHQTSTRPGLPDPTGTCLAGETCQQRRRGRPKGGGEGRVAAGERCGAHFGRHRASGGATRRRSIWLAPYGSRTKHGGATAQRCRTTGCGGVVARWRGGSPGGGAQTARQQHGRELTAKSDGI
jgi:hypothetical protein